jgi:hypothetical protein
MKKLLIACITVALAAGAWAAGEASAFSQTKNSFENADDFTSGALNVEGQWVCEDTDATLKQVAYVADTDPAPTYSGSTRSFDGDNENYLSIDTGSGKPLWRTFAADGSACKIWDSNGKTEADYVIDTLVQFTGTDTEPAILTTEEGAAIDQLVIWMKTVEDDNGNKTSTLNVKCGILDELINGAGTTNIVLGANVSEGQWARLSVKSVIIPDTTSGVYDHDSVGFVIYVDGVAVGAADIDGYKEAIAYSDWEDAPTEVNKAYIGLGQLFPSILASGSTGAATITQVGFEGSGKIDDLQILTLDDAPAFVKAEPTPAVTTHTVSFVAKGLDDGVTWEGAGDVEVDSGSTLTTDQIPTTTVEGYDFKGWFSDETCETAITAEALAAMTFTEATTTIYAKFEAATVTYTVTFAQKGLEGDAATAWTAPTIDPVVSGQAISALPDAPAVDGYTASAWQYDDGTAYEAQEITEAITLYVTYTAVETDPDPIAPGATAEFTDKTKADTWAANKDNIVIPSSLTTDAAKDAYKSYLVGTVTGNDNDGYTVTFDIDSTKEAALETALEEVLPKVLDGTEITTAVPGFYYAVKACDTVGGEYAVKGDWAQAGDDGTVTLSVTKTKGKTAEFYKIVVQAVDPNAAK